MIEFIPTSATTYCDVVAGNIGNTIDGDNDTYVEFNDDQTCLTQWEWNDKFVNNFYILSSEYTEERDCHIYGIWLKINGSYEKVWEGELYLPNNAWHSIEINRLCSGLRIAQKHTFLEWFSPRIYEVYGEEAEDEWHLHYATTCLLVNGPGDPGPKITEFHIDDIIYAYSEIQGSDMYGKVVKHEWWYKEKGASDFTKKWEYIWDPIDDHYIGYANWSWTGIGNLYGPGIGYIKIYLDDVYMGKTNNYDVYKTNGDTIDLLPPPDWLSWHES